jgi:hypothetical protein
MPVRHLFVFTIALALLAGLYFWAQGRTAHFPGVLAMQDIEGREVSVEGAKLAWYPADVVEQQLQFWLADYDEWRRVNGLQIRAARNEWNQGVALRDEAARILRVAERANSSDLQICRARHRESAADAEDALRRMEQFGSSGDHIADPFRFFASLPAPSMEFSAKADGEFSVEAQQGGRGYLVVVMERGDDPKGAIVWLREVADGDGETIKLANSDILTVDSLAKIARSIKKPDVPEGPPDE